ncbi:MAG: DUF2950 family protein [Hyphomicrobiales bacterium]|nr:DUF2950 family protein [Hyphomicrobiales bacterium]
MLRLNDTAPRCTKTIALHAGTVFQKDLGPRTSIIAEHMASFNPDPTWQRVSDTSLPE